MNIIMLAVLVIALWTVIKLSRPTTIYDGIPSHGRYIVVNHFTQIPCFSGRTFRTYKGAARYARRNLTEWPYLAVDILKVL